MPLDNGMYKIWFARNYRTSVANTLLLDNALATMGAGLPSAIAASLIHPDRRVLAVCGDGGFMMNSQELETAVRLKLNLVVLVLEDHAYGMIRWKQEVDAFPDFGLEFGNPDFVAYAKSYGAKGSRVGKASELSTMLEAAFEEGGVHLVVVPVDYSENMRVLVNELHPGSPGQVKALRRCSARKSISCRVVRLNSFQGRIWIRKDAVLSTSGMNRNSQRFGTDFFDEPFFQPDEFGCRLDLVGSRVG